MVGGDGAHPVGDACDFARYCAGLDFWSINDHAETLTPRRWSETIDSIRQCNAVSGDAQNPDVVAFLGWEWTQIGSTPANHYGHKNVILRDLERRADPDAADLGGAAAGRAAAARGRRRRLDRSASFALSDIEGGGLDLARYLAETVEPEAVPDGRPGARAAERLPRAGRHAAGALREARRVGRRRRW